MRQAENATAPFFGHHPQDFGIPDEPLRFDKDNRLIEPLHIADKMEQLENLYVRWMRRPFSNWILRVAHEPIRIFREQVWILSRGYAQALNDLRAIQQQVQQVESNIPQIKKRAELRNFLAEHFSRELTAAEVRNLDLIDVCMSTMLELKERK